MFILFTARRAADSARTLSLLASRTARFPVQLPLAVVLPVRVWLVPPALRSLAKVQPSRDVIVLPVEVGCSSIIRVAVSDRSLPSQSSPTLCPGLLVPLFPRVLSPALFAV